MTGRHVTTAITMLVLVGILILGVVVGARELFAPLPGEDEEPQAAEPTADCAPAADRPGRLRSSQITVNVYNGGNRAGLAGQTLDTLSARGFRAGEAGNAPADNNVRRVQVWIVEGEELAGSLVARNFGPKVPVKTLPSEEDLGDGIDVVVGNGRARLASPSRSIKIPADADVCVPVASEGAATES